MREVKIDRGFTLEELTEKVEYLEKETKRITARRKDNHHQRSASLSNFSIAWAKTYMYFMELAPELSDETFKKLYYKLIKQRDSLVSYAIFGGKQYG